MRFSDILHLCRQNLTRRKSRSILTVLGVVVGCCSIVMMVSLGQGINEQNEQMLKQMGDLTIVTVYTQGGGYGEVSPGASTGTGANGDQIKLDDKAVAAFRAIPGVTAATPTLELPASASVKAGPGGRYVSDYAGVIGIDMQQLDAMGYELLDGKAPTGKGQVLVGQYFAWTFADTFNNNAQRTNPEQYGSGFCTYDAATGECVTPEPEDPFIDPLTSKMELLTGAQWNGLLNMSGGMGTGMGGTGGAGTGAGASATQPVTMDFTAAGVVKEDQNKGWTTSSGIIMDIAQLRELIAKVDPAAAKSTAYSMAYVKAADLAAVSDVEAQIKAMGFQTSSFEQIRDSLEEQSRGIQLALGGIGAVSFLVAAIGIANTMIMSVTERTREIGIMKALGCYVRDIRMMFLGEAGFIGLLGGLIGCVISAAGSLAINMLYIGMGGGAGYAMSGGSAGSAAAGGDGGLLAMVGKLIVGGDDVARISVIPWWLYVAAVAFSTAVGVIAGFGPANKAVRIPALDAIKNSE